MRASSIQAPVIAQLSTHAQSPRALHARPAANRAAVGRALALVHAFVGQAGLRRDEAERLAIIVEEWIANVVEHGTPPPDSRIGLRLARGPSTIRITMTDAGHPFDPRKATFENANLERGGGVGLELMRAWSRVLVYRRRAGRNRLVLEMPLG